MTHAFGLLAIDIAPGNPPTATCLLDMTDRGPCVIESHSVSGDGDNQYACILLSASSNYVVFRVSVLATANNSQISNAAFTGQTNYDYNCLSIPIDPTTEFRLQVSATSPMTSLQSEQLAEILRVKLLRDMPRESCAHILLLMRSC